MFGQYSWHKCESFAHFTQDERVVLANLSTPSLAQSRSAKEGILTPIQIQTAHFSSVAMPFYGGVFGLCERFESDLHGRKGLFGNVLDLIGAYANFDCQFTSF